MSKRAIAYELREKIKHEWGVENLAETQKSSYIYLFKLIDNYTEDEVLSAAKWLKTWKIPRCIANLWFAMPRWKEEQSKKTVRTNWQYT